MGLDFSIYAKKRNCELDEEGYPKYETDIVELAYGRKSWELVAYLFPNENLNTDKLFYPVNIELWNKLIVDLAKLQDKSGGTFEEISDAYEEVEIYYDAPELLEDRYKRLIYRFEHFFDQIFNDSPTLGYDFAIGYLISFRDADKKLQEYYKNPDYEIVAIISY